MNVYGLLVFAHVAGTIISVGGATMSDALFFKSVRNRKISKDEFKLLHEAGKVIWGGLALVVLAGLGLIGYQHMQGSVTLYYQAYFQMKMLLIGVVIVNGLVFHMKVLPLLKAHLGEDLREKALSQYFWLFSLTGAISIVSWWSIVVLAVLNPDLPLLLMLNLYAVLVVFGSLFGYLMMTHVIFGDDAKKTKKKVVLITKTNVVGFAIALVLVILLLVFLVLGGVI